MNKKHCYILFAVLFVFLMIPYAVGVVFQRHYEELLKITANHLHVDLRVAQYQRGFFHSHVTLTSNFPLLDKPLPEELQGEKVLVIQQKITHGPLIFSHGFTPALAHIESFLNGRQPIASTWVRLDRSISTRLDIRHYALSAGHHAGPYYAVNHLVGYSFYNNASHKFTANVRCDAIDANVENPRHIKDFVFQRTLIESPSHLWLGKTKYHFGTLAWQHDSDVYAFKDFDYEINSYESGKKVSATLMGNMTQAALNGHDYGAQAVALNFSNLDAAQLKRFTEVFSLSKSHLLTPGQFLVAKQQLLALLDAGAVIQVNALQLNTTWGPVIVAAVSNGNCQKQSATTFTNWCSNADLRVRANLPTPLVYKVLLGYCQFRPDYVDGNLARKWVDDQLAVWQNAGWLRNTGKQLLIQYAHGKLAVDKIRISS